MSESLVNSLTGGTPVTLDQNAINALPESLRVRAKLHDGGIYVGDPSNPKVGDLKIKLTKADAMDVTVVAKQQGNTLVPWTTSQNTTIAMVEKGTKSSDEVFASAQSANETRTWIVRLLGFLCMLIGFSMIFRPLSVVADVVPFIGSIVGMGTGIVAFALAAPLSFVTIAIAWIVYRPIIGITMLVLGIGIFVGIFVAAKKRRAAKA